MKKKAILFILMAVCQIGAFSQKYRVVSVTGKVTLENAESPVRQLRLREALTSKSMLNLGYKCQVELFDEQANTKYVLTTPGRASVGEMIKNGRSSAIRLTGKYLAYIKDRMKGNGELTSRRYSDPAFVTREIAVMLSDYEKEYLAFQKQAMKKYEDFRREAIKSYAQFVRNAWQEYGAKPPVSRPDDEKTEPVVFDEKEAVPVVDRPISSDSVPVLLPDSTIQVNPAWPIAETEVEEGEYVDFVFFGTPLKVRFTQKEDFRLDDCSPESVAKVFEKMAGSDYNNTIRDCLQLRSFLQLGDWAYLRLLETFSKACFPTSDEATLLMTFLCQQSGYQVRIAVADGSLRMLFATAHTIYNHAFFEIDGHNYYVYGPDVDNINLCPASYPGENPVSLAIQKEMLLAETRSETRHLEAKGNLSLTADVTVNKNLMDFYDSYPSSMTDGNFMTRWAMYANVPLDETLRDGFLSDMKQKIKGKSQKDAVSHLLNWVQTAFEYEYDETLWGHDRAFFPEETLFYPYCDCEDRSILLSRLVRDLLGLPTVLIYYPGHLAMAVCFTEEEVTGDFLMVQGQKFVVCDPTYIGAPIGMSMPEFSAKGSEVKAILVQ